MSKKQSKEIKHTWLAQDKKLYDDYADLRDASAAFINCNIFSAKKRLEYSELIRNELLCDNFAAEREKELSQQDIKIKTMPLSWEKMLLSMKKLESIEQEGESEEIYLKCKELAEKKAKNELELKTFMGPLELALYYLLENKNLNNIILFIKNNYHVQWPYETAASWHEVLDFIKKSKPQQNFSQDTLEKLWTIIKDTYSIQIPSAEDFHHALKSNEDETDILLAYVISHTFSACYSDKLKSIHPPLQEKARAELSEFTAQCQTLLKEEGKKHQKKLFPTWNALFFSLFDTDTIKNTSASTTDEIYTYFISCIKQLKAHAQKCASDSEQKLPKWNEILTILKIFHAKPHHSFQSSENFTTDHDTLYSAVLALHNLHKENPEAAQPFFQECALCWRPVPSDFMGSKSEVLCQFHTRVKSSSVLPKTHIADRGSKIKKYFTGSHILQKCAREMQQVVNIIENISKTGHNVEKERIYTIYNSIAKNLKDHQDFAKNPEKISEILSLIEALIQKASALNTDGKSETYTSLREDSQKLLQYCKNTALHLHFPKRQRLLCSALFALRPAQEEPIPVEDIIALHMGTISATSLQNKPDPWPKEQDLLAALPHLAQILQRSKCKLKHPRNIVDILCPLFPSIDAEITQHMLDLNSAYTKNYSLFIPTLAYAEIWLEANKKIFDCIHAQDIFYNHDPKKYKLKP